MDDFENEPRLQKADNEPEYYVGPGIPPPRPKKKFWVRFFSYISI